MSYNIFQILTLILLAVTIGKIFEKLAQPKVVGQILAGIILGDTITGKLFPNFYHAVFATPSQEALEVITKIALIIIVVEIPKFIQNHGNAHTTRPLAFLTALLGVATLVVLGATVAYWAKSDLSPNEEIIPYLLYCGLALSASAIPVLLHIIKTRRNLEPRVGSMALHVSIHTDVITWLGVALFFSSYNFHLFSLNQSSIHAITIVAYILTLLAIKKVMQECRAFETSSQNNETACGIALCFVLASALVTNHIGLHYISGAFFAALILQSRPGFANTWNRWVGRFSDTVLTPLFFAYCGTQITITLDNTALLIWSAAFVPAILMGKLLAALIIGKAFGIASSTYVQVGLLTSTKGIMDILILQIGVEAKIISIDTYQVLLVAALTTTALINPLLSLWGVVYARKVNTHRKMT